MQHNLFIQPLVIVQAIILSLNLLIGNRYSEKKVTGKNFIEFKI